MPAISTIKNGLSLFASDSKNIKNAKTSSSSKSSQGKYLIGQNGPEIRGSKTIVSNKGLGRIDIENPKPGKRSGSIHLHDAKNNKWQYKPKEYKFYDADGVEEAPNYIQNLLNQEWIRKGLEKARKYLNERIFFE